MGKESQSRTLILGIGNVLLSDEGAGIHALNHFGSMYEVPDTFVLLDGGTLSFTLAADIESATHLLVFDAASLRSPPGTVQCFEGAEMDGFLAKGGRSVHEVGLIDLLDIARLVGRLPEHRALIGIQPETLTWGEQVSKALEPAIPKAAAMASSLLQQWHGDTSILHAKNSGIAAL
ncbi:MAG: HyaD/HybD family hydrogenase maturation endopeptidase [Gammaproteobacteria bacterium]|nr:HyaD/HybD family hydrogenase maturation endopeptidase [Gammaproteobacteria bacterium]